MSELVAEQKMPILLSNRGISIVVYPILTGLQDNLAALCYYFERILKDNRIRRFSASTASLLLWDLNKTDIV